MKPTFNVQARLPEIRARARWLGPQADETRTRWGIQAHVDRLLLLEEIERLSRENAALRLERLGSRVFADPVGIHSHGASSEPQEGCFCGACDNQRAIAMLRKVQVHAHEVQPLYVFWTRRPQDRCAWPLVYQDRARAEAAPHRVSAIAEVFVADPSAERRP